MALNALLRCSSATRPGWTSSIRSPRRSTRRSTGSTTAAACSTGWSRRSWCPPTCSKRIRREALPGEFDAVADQARRPARVVQRLRAQAQEASADGEDLAELEPLNRLLEPRRHLHADRCRAEGRDSRLGFRPSADGAHRSPCSPRSARRWPACLHGDFEDVKACEGPACTLLFVDHTRGRARRWCSMAICGNRAKQAAHRHRLKREH